VSAIGTAAACAVHQLYDDPPKVLDDPVTPVLLEAAEPGAIERAMQGPSPRDQPLTRTHVVRQRFAEDELAATVRRGIAQYVLLGAGADTFAYRQPPYATDLTVFEVDHPASQAWKRRALDAAGITPPPNLRWAPIDFERQALLAGLTAAGFDPARPACFSWLGVTMFLTRPAVEATLRLVAGLPAPTTIVFSFILSDDALPPEEAERKHTVIARFERGDEPWLTDFHPDALRDTLHGLGFRDVFLLTPEKVGARYLTGRRDGMRSRPVEQVYRATV